MLTKSLKFLLLLLVMSAGLIYLFRTDLLAYTLGYQLDRLGVQQHSFKVQDISLEGLLIEDLSLGSQHEFRTDTLQAVWDMDSLIQGHIQSVNIENLHMIVDATEGKPPLGSLQVLLEQQSQKEPATRSAPPQLPKVVFNNANIQIKSDTQDVRLIASGQIEHAHSGELVFETQFDVSATDSTQEVNTSGQVNGLVKDMLTEAPELEANVEMEGDWDHQGLDLQKPARFSTGFDLKTALQVPGPEDWRNWFQQIKTSGSAKFNVQQVSMPEQWDGLQVFLPLSFELQEGVAKVLVSQKASMTADQLHKEWLRTLGIPEALQSFEKGVALNLKSDNHFEMTLDEGHDSNFLKSAVRLALSDSDAELHLDAVGDASFSSDFQLSDFEFKDAQVDGVRLNIAKNVFDSIHIQGDVSGTRVAVEAKLDVEGHVSELDLGSAKARQVRLQLPLELNTQENTGTIQLSKAGSFQATRLSGLGDVQLRNSLDVKLKRGVANYSLEQGKFLLNHDLTLRPKWLNFRIKGDSPLDAQVRPGNLRLKGQLMGDGEYKGDLRVQSAKLNLPQQEIELSGISSTIPFELEKGKVSASFNVRDITHLADPPYFPPLGLGGSVNAYQGKISMKASGGVKGLNNLALNGRHNLKSGKGYLDFVGKPLNFTPGGLQPSVLSPDLAVLEDAVGSVASRGQLRWSPKGVSSQGKVDLDGWSFDLGNLRISGLNAGLALTDLISSQSEPGQRIEIARIDAGIPLESLQASYQITGKESPVIQLDHLQVSVLDGEVAVAPTVIDPQSEDSKFQLEIKALSLNELFSFIDVEGLGGNGQLSGVLPLRISGDQISITDGRLAADSGGVLRLTSETVSQVLGGRVENVDMLIEALTEFHYQELSLILNNSSNNDLVVNLSMLGGNPNVMDGRPFRLNINLESNISKILDAVAQGYGLSNEALQRALRLR